MSGRTRGVVSGAMQQSRNRGKGGKNPLPQKPPVPKARTITYTAPGPILINTVLTAAVFQAKPSAGPGTVTVSHATAAPAGKVTITLSIAEGGGFAAASATVPINVVLPRRTLSWTPPSSLVYGTPLTIADVQFQAGEGDPPELQFPLGELQVGQTGKNLRIVAKGKPGASTDAELSATVVVTAAPRTIQFKVPGPMLLGTKLTNETFDAKPSAGPGAVALSHDAAAPAAR